MMCEGVKRVPTSSRDLGPVATVAGILMLLAGSAMVLFELVDVDTGMDLSRVVSGAVVAGLGIPLIAWPILRRAGIVEDPNAPWVEALARLAAEHGQLVQSDPRAGAWFDLVHGGPRFMVLVEPAHGRLTLRCRRPTRHGIVVVRRGESPAGEPAHWGEVLRGGAWSLRAEVRIAAHSLTEAHALHRALDRFFIFGGARTVLLSNGSLTLELELPPPEAVEGAVRGAIDAARAISASHAG